MICPFCKKEMEEGFIPACKETLQWIPKDEDIPWTIYKIAKGGVRLSKNPILSSQRVIAYCCKQCDMVIIPVEKENK